MDTLKVSATGHGINYFPEYYARASGGFAKRGLTVTATARDPWTGVLDDVADGSADVVLGGLWVPAMYAGMGRDLVTVGQLNARFPTVIMTREAVPDFDWSWLRGRVVLAPGAGSTAYYEFTAGLMREAGVDPCEARFGRDLSTGMYVELFKHGLGDVLIVDPLTAARLQREGCGFISCKLARVGGAMPNSVYYVRRDRLEALHDRVVRFLSAIREAMITLNSGSVETMEYLTAEFPGVAPEDLQDVTTELVANGTWSGIRVDREACDRWVSMLRTAGLVGHAVSYEELVDDSTVDEAERLDVS